MTRTNARRLFSCTVLAVAAFALGCSQKGGTYVESRSQALTTSNGLLQNGLSTNGLLQNGLLQNGLLQNGLLQNGLLQNGLLQNGLLQNGLLQNGLLQNGLLQNGLLQNGLFQTALWQGGQTGNAAYPATLLRSSAYLRQLFQYIYACAMPATTYDTTLDPNNGALLCSDADARSDGGAACDAGYTCSLPDGGTQGTCVVPLKGAMGVGINADGTSWGASGNCDESCQRWVTACVLARTNAYGVHVEISMRAPDDAPQAIKDALKLANGEGSSCPDGSADDTTCGYTLREGAYYGNIFAIKPANPAPSLPVGAGGGTAGGTSSGTDGGADGGVVPDSGPTIVPIIQTPVFYACAGPESNIPAITKRFCSSQGDRVVINVPGECLTTATEAGTCASEGPSGTMQDCYTGASSQPRGQCADYRDPNCYNEVITVYLKQPIAVCGNGVCEDDGTATSPETPASCPSDCHPGTWSTGFDLGYTLGWDNTYYPNTTFAGDYGLSAVGPDDSIVVVLDSTSAVSFGGATFPAGNEGGILIKYNPDGSYAFPSRGLRFTTSPAANPAAGGLGVTAIAVAQRGPAPRNIAVTGAGGPAGADLWLDVFSPSGTPAGAWSWSFGSPSSLPEFYPASVAFDSQGNVVVYGTYLGTATIPTSPQTLFSTPGSISDYNNAQKFLLKISPQGTIIWAKSISSEIFAGALALDPNDNIIVSSYQVGNDPSAPGLLKLCADGTTGGSTGQCADSSQSWSKSVFPYGMFTTSAVDLSGNIFAGGTYGANTDLGGKPLTIDNGYGYPPFIVKYDSNGKFQWANLANVICPDGVVCGGGILPSQIGFDPSFNPVLASRATGPFGGGIDFGAGVFPIYAAPTMFVAAYASDGVQAGQPLWSKQISGILGIAGGMTLDSTGRVVVSGVFAGSMTADGQFLVTPVPESGGAVDGFLASFGGPSTSDKTAPVIGGGTDESGTQIDTVPATIIAQATGPTGADVFFMPPTAIDTGYAGTNVSCQPPPNTTFSIGTTTVTCTASDPLGNRSTAQFNVVVSDNLGPVFSGVADIKVTAPIGATGATVSFTPTATDQVDGSRPVTCTPPSGSTFSVGQTTVTCTASDARQPTPNQSSATFVVTVASAAPPITVTCLGTPTSPAILSTSPGVCGAAVNTSDAGSCSAGAGSAATCTFDGTSSETLGPGVHSVLVVGLTTAGSTASCTSYVRVADNQKPVATCASQTVQCTGNGGATVTPAAVCADNCSCTASCATAQFPVGTSSGVCTATDPSGNSATCQPVITVVDSTPPVVTPRPGPSQLQCHVDTWTDPGAIALDVCVGDLSGAVQTSGAVDPTHSGSYTETYTATDPSGNKGSATRTVAVVDTLAPILTLNASSATLQCGVPYVEAGAKATDVCAGDLTSKITETGAVTPTAPGTYAVTYSVKDPSGNGATASRTVSVVDTVSPTITATVGPSTAANRTININITSYTVTPKGGGTTVSGSASCWTAPGIAITLNAADACALKQLVYSLSGAQSGGATVAGGNASFTVSKTGSTTVSFYATDKAGNQAATQTIPIYIGQHPLGFGFSCAPSLSLKSLPPHGTITAKGTVTLTVGKKTTTQPFSFTQSY